MLIVKNENNELTTQNTNTDNFDKDLSEISNTLKNIVNASIDSRIWRV